MLLLGATAPTLAATAPTLADESELARGQYLVDLLGCGRCHTEGYLVGNEAHGPYLAGSQVGIAYTAYSDGIDNRSDIDLATESDLPPSTLFHANYYENPGCGFFQLCGGPIAGADINLNVTATPWGATLDHFQVDDAPEVTSAIRDHILGVVPR